MKASDIPAKFNIPFANGAGSSYKRTVPQASQIGITNGAASLTDGFPPLTFQPVASGGVPPFGQDTNGILNQITAWSRWQNAGALVKYDSAFSSAIGGYPQGALLASSVTAGLVFFNLADDNTTNPDGGSSANWLSYYWGTSVEVGSATLFALPASSSAFPSGYLECNGAAISRTTYSALYAKISTIWGAGDGSTTFNLPDARGVSPRGFDNGRGLDPGRVFGSYQADAYASHSHGVSDPGHAHGVSDPGHHHVWHTNNINNSGQYMSITNGVSSYTTYWATDAATTGIGINGNTTGISINASGSSETRAKNVTFTFGIKY